MKAVREKGEAGLRARPHLGAEPGPFDEEFDFLLDILDCWRADIWLP
jgi:hypothetical protein